MRWKIVCIVHDGYLAFFAIDVLVSTDICKMVVFRIYHTRAKIS